jgi:hypothetical protein
MVVSKMNKMSGSASNVRERVVQARSILQRELKQRPGRTAAIALGAGFVLGGGLFSALTARILATGVRMGLRVALIPMVTQGLAAWGENLIKSGGDENANSDSPDDSDKRSERRST